MRVLPKHLLGQTGLTVSVIGLGTVKFGRNQGVKYPHGFDLPEDGVICRLLDCALSLGVNLLDTAPAYGISEERLGKLMGDRRKDFVLSTKVGEEFVDGKSFYDFSGKHAKFSIERSLKRLNTDWLDIVLIHSNGDDEKIIHETDVIEVLLGLKEKGLIRAFGMSTKTIAGGKLAVDVSDVVMVTHNLQSQDERPVIAHAHAQNKGVLIKKALLSGDLSASTPEEALEFVLNEPGVSSVIIGTLSEDHLRGAVATALAPV